MDRREEVARVMKQTIRNQANPHRIRRTRQQESGRSVFDQPTYLPAYLSPNIDNTTACIQHITHHYVLFQGKKKAAKER